MIACYLFDSIRYTDHIVMKGKVFQKGVVLLKYYRNVLCIISSSLYLIRHFIFSNILPHYILSSLYLSSLYL